MFVTVTALTCLCSQPNCHPNISPTLHTHPITRSPILSRWPRNVRQWYCWLVSISDVFWTHTSARVCCHPNTSAHKREYKYTFNPIQEHYSCLLSPIYSDGCIDNNTTLRQERERERTLSPTKLIPRCHWNKHCCWIQHTGIMLGECNGWLLILLPREEQCSHIMQSVLQQHTHIYKNTYTLTLLDLKPAPAPSFWSLMMSMSMTMNSSICRGLQRVLKGLRQYVFPSTSATSL